MTNEPFRQYLYATNADTTAANAASTTSTTPTTTATSASVKTTNKVKNLRLEFGGMLRRLSTKVT